MKILDIDKEWSLIYLTSDSYNGSSNESMVALYTNEKDRIFPIYDQKSNFNHMLSLNDTIEKELLYYHLNLISRTNQLYSKASKFILLNV